MRGRKRAVLWLFLLIFIFPKKLYAQSTMNFENITSDDGLSQGTIESIVQDKKGYLWFASNEGLNRYNGKEIKIFKHDMDDTENSILNNYVTSLGVDDKNNLWIGTYSGVSKMDLSDSSIKNYIFDKNKTHHILSMYVSKDNKVYAGSHQGIFIYDEKTDKFYELPNVNKNLNYENIFCINEDDEGNLWVGAEKGLKKIDIKTNKVTQVDVGNVKTEEWGKIHCITFENKDIMWVGTDNNGLKRIDLLENEVTSFMADENDLSKLQSNIIRKVLIDSQKNMWVGTTKGLSKYLGKDKFITYAHAEYDNTSLSSNIIFDMYEDKSGLIWVGDFAGVGVFNNKNKILTYKNTEDKDSLSSNIIFGVYEDDEGNLWVGTRDKGLNIINRKNNTITHIKKGSTEYDLNSDAISCITGKGDTIWVATSYGLNKIDKKTGKIKKFTTKDGISHNNIKSLFIDSENNLWIGTYRGLNILNIDTDEITNINDKLVNAGIKAPHIHEIYEDDDGIIWIGGFSGRGLIKYDKKKDTIKVFKTYNYNKRTTSIDTVTHIIDGGNNTLWIGTSGGLLKFDKEKEIFKEYTKKDGLSNNVIYGILTDDKGNLWMSTNDGISKFDIKNNEFKNLNESDGLQGKEFNAKSAYKCKSGELVFGGLKGLNIFDTNQIQLDNYTGEVELEEFNVLGENLIENNEKILKHNENFIRISFFLNDYKDSDEVEYYYKLEGLNHGWESTDNNHVIFNNLKPGKYTFIIKSKNSKGVISKENKIKFTIKPSFWKSKGAYNIYLFLIILIIYLCFNRMKALDILVHKRTKELNEEMEKNKELFDQVIDAERRKNNYFINLSHELRTPLNVLNSIEQLISNYCDSGKQIKNEQLSNYMNMMKNNTSRLMNLINNILDTSKMENGKYIINKQEQDIVYIVEEAALSLKKSIESAGIELVIDTDVEEKIINCDKTDIEKCIINLVGNAVKFTPSGGQIIVNIEDIEDGVKIIVSDTGMGIDEEYHNSIFDRFNQVVDEHSESKNGSGLGLTITKQIIDMHNGEITLESEKDKGCKFTIILPA